MTGEWTWLLWGHKSAIYSLHHGYYLLHIENFNIYIYIYIYIYCDVVCYRERKREINSPTLLCLNQLSLRLTAKTVGEWRSIPRTQDLQSVEQTMESRSLRYHDRIQWWEKRKVKWLAIDSLVPKWYLFVRGNLEKNLQFEDSSQRIKTLVYSQTLGGNSPTKKKNNKSLVLDRHWRKRDANSANSEVVTCP